MGNVDDLTRLKELLDSGVLSQEEFNIEKEKILNNNSNNSAQVKGKNRPSSLYTIARVLGIITAIVLALMCILVSGNTAKIVFIIALIIDIVITTKFIDNLIDSHFNGVAKFLISLVRIVIIGLFLITPFRLTSTSSNDSDSVETRVEETARDYMFKCVDFKDPQSVVVKGYNLKTYEGDDDENQETYYVTIKVSGENSLGGVTSDQFTVTVIYNSVTDEIKATDIKE